MMKHKQKIANNLSQLFITLIIALEQVTEWAEDYVSSFLADKRNVA